MDPTLTAMNQRLLNFASAIHFAATEKRSEHGAKGKAKVKKVVAKKVRKEGEEEGPVNNFEFVEEHKTCSASGKLGKYSKKSQGSRGLLHAMRGGARMYRFRVLPK